MELSLVVSASDDVVAREVAGETVLLNLASGTYFGLNETGTLIWELIEEDSITLDAFLASDAGKACCESAGFVADDKEVLGLGVGAGLRKGEDDLKAKIDSAIAAIRVYDTYDAITAKYFASSIYGD